MQEEASFRDRILSHAKVPMFQKLLVLLVFALVGVIVALVLSYPEEFSEKLLPIVMVGIVVMALFVSWYLGFFLASEKPPLVMIYIGIAGLLIAFMSGYFIGGKV